jgi:uncharacterized membrane protein YkvA (DUF1232 family)
MKNTFEKYGHLFTEGGLLNKMKRYARQAGMKAVYSVLLMYYAFRRKETPYWARHIITGVLGYFIAPIDALPDLTPIIGFTDDLGMLSFGLVMIAAYVNDEVRIQARTKLRDWFGELDLQELQEIDSKLGS